MAEIYDSNDPRSRERVNPSVESTRVDDEMARQARENAQGLGSVAGAGVGCLGMALLPWVMAGAAILLGVVVIVLWRMWGK